MTEHLLMLMLMLILSMTVPPLQKVPRLVLVPPGSLPLEKVARAALGSLPVEKVARAVLDLGSLLLLPENHKKVVRSSLLLLPVLVPGSLPLEKVVRAALGSLPVEKVARAVLDL